MTKMKKEKKHSLSKPGPMCNFSLFSSSYLTLLSFIFPPLLNFSLPGNESELPPSATPCLEATWQSVAPTLWSSHFENEGSWPHLLSGVFPLWPPTCSVPPYFICSLSCCTCKSRKWAPSADFSLFTTEQLSPTTQSYVLLPRTI